MPVIYRQKAFHELAAEQQQLKLQRDTEYEFAVRESSTKFYNKKHTTGVTPAEQAAFESSQRQLWEDYRAWAIQEGLYEEVSVEEQRVELEERLNSSLAEANELRSELDMKQLEIREKERP